MLVDEGLQLPEGLCVGVVIQHLGEIGLLILLQEGEVLDGAGTECLQHLLVDPSFPHLLQGQDELLVPEDPHHGIGVVDFIKFVAPGVFSDGINEELVLFPVQPQLINLLLLKTQQLDLLHLD